MLQSDSKIECVMQENRRNLVCDERCPQLYASLLLLREETSAKFERAIALLMFVLPLGRMRGGPRKYENVLKLISMWEPFVYLEVRESCND